MTEQNPITAEHVVEADTDQHEGGQALGRQWRLERRNLRSDGRFAIPAFQGASRREGS
jgi:hypothetical protein